MQSSIVEYCGIPVEWKIPQLKVGDTIRYWYWNNTFTKFAGNRGKIIAIRYLSSSPILNESKKKNTIIRGNIIYTLKLEAKRAYMSGTYEKYKKSRKIWSIYNQKMSNVEIIE